MTYDICRQPLIHCVFRDGSCRPLGLMETLQQATQITDLRHRCPQDDFAVYRFLLALLAWVEPCRDAEELRQRWEQGLPQPLLNGVEGKTAGQFDLFHPERPFLQDPAVKSKERRPVADLAWELPADTAINHFSHVRDKVTGLCPSCCGHGLLRLPAFCTQGGQGKAPSINDAPPVYLLPVGQTLLETLLLNWPERSMSGDRPCWEGTTADGEIDWMEGFTWQPRCARLPQPTAGDCVLCGSATDGVIREIVFVKGRMRSDERNRPWRDPHVAFVDPRGKRTALRGPEPLKSPDAAAGLWRQVIKAVLQSLDNAEEDLGIPAVRLAAGRLEADRTLRVRCFVPSTRQAKILHDAATEWRLAPAVFRNAEQVAALVEELDRLDNGVQALGKHWLSAVLANDVSQQSKRKGVEAISWLRMTLPDFESTLERIFRRLLDGRENIQTWWATVRDTARRWFVESAARNAAGPLDRRELRDRIGAAIDASFDREDR